MPTRLRKKIVCDKCGLDRSVLIYQRLNCKICIQCLNAEKEVNKKLIKNMVFPVNVDAPLGWHFVDQDYFTDEKKGRNWANHLYTSKVTAIN